MTDVSMVRNNCEAVLNPLSDKEVNAKETIHNMFFKPLKVHHWEGVEVREYWKSMRETS